MRILLIIDSYPPHLGGSEIEAQRVSSGLIRRGHRVDVLCSGGPPMPPVREWIDSEGVPVTILTRNSKGVWKDRVFAVNVVRELWRRRKTYDVVYFLMQGLQVAAGLPFARMLHKPSVMKIAGSGVIPLMRSSRAGRLELDWLRKWKTTLLLLNEGMMQEAVADGFSRDQLVWMPNPVDVDIFCPATPQERLAWRADHGLPAEAPIVIYVGRLSAEKGLEGLLRGFAVTIRSAPEAILLLVGDGPTRGHLTALRDQLGLSDSQVRFAGRAPVADVPRWLAAADAFALTSPSEGFPCALVEAMAAGLPSVASAIPANLQLIDHGVHGLTVEWNNPDDIGAAILALFEAPDLRRKMGIAARERAQANYSMDAVMKLYEELFTDVVKRDLIV